MSVVNYIRFPVSVADKDIYDQYGSDIPAELMEESWIDINPSHVSAVRQFIEKDGTVSGTTLYVSGLGEVVVNIKPSKVRELLSYSITKATN